MTRESSAPAAAGAWPVPVLRFPLREGGGVRAWSGVFGRILGRSSISSPSWSPERFARISRAPAEADAVVLGDEADHVASGLPQPKQ